MRTSFNVFENSERVSMRSSPHHVRARSTSDRDRFVRRSLTLESLESRKLLATVAFSGRSNYGGNESQWTSSAYYQPEEDHDLRLEYESNGDEFIVFGLSMAGHLRGEIHVLGPHGERDESWTVRRGGQQTAWVSGTTHPEPGTTTLVIGNVDAKLNATAHLGATYQSAPVPESIPIDAGQFASDEGFAMRTFGYLPADGPRPISYEEDFASADTNTRWSVDATGPGGAQFGSELVIQTGQHTEQDVFVDGVLVDYDSDTGNFRVSAGAHTALTTFQVTSSSGWFQGERPAAIAEGAFNSFHPGKLFVLDPEGRSAIDFGPVLPTGLSQNELEAELSVDGSYAFGGRVGVVVYSVDGEVSMSAAESRFFRPLHVSNIVTVEGHLGVHAGEVIAFDYRWEADSHTLDAPNRFAAKASFEYTTDGKSSSSVPLEPCHDWCHVEFTVPQHRYLPSSLTFERAIKVAFQNQSIETDLVVDNLQLLGPHGDGVQRFEISAHPDRHTEVAVDQADARLFDANGALITLSRHFTLTPSSDGDETYTLHVLGQGVYRLDVAVGHSDSPNGAESPDARVKDNSLLLQWNSPIDLRTCRVEDFTWDGPRFAAIDFDSWFQEVHVTTHGTIEQGMYKLEIRNGACLELSTRKPTASEVIVDFQPPEIVDVPLEQSHWMKTGDGMLVLRYSEKVGPVIGDFRLDRESREGDASIAVQSSLTPDNTRSAADYVMLDVGVLEPGSYSLRLDIRARDRSGNESDETLTLPFVVSDQPPVDLAMSRFDIDQDGTVDRKDYELLRWWATWRTDDDRERFDLNADGRVDASDTVLLVHVGLGSPKGDVDLDGDFDRDDLAVLLSLVGAGRRRPAVGAVTYGISGFWTTGDFNGDGRFDSSDLVAAFTELDGEFE